MGASLDKYIEEVNKPGDEISALLEKIFSSTLRNSEYIDVISSGMGGIKVIRPPINYLAVVHSAGGDPTRTNAQDYSESVIDKLVKGAEVIGATPVAFANVIDASKGDKETILPLGEFMANRANKHKISCLNGELAILGDRVTVPANISATMVSFVHRNDAQQDNIPGYFWRDRDLYAIFDPQVNAIYMNSDGVGTWTELCERQKNFSLAKRASLAMKLDDLIKIGASARVVSDIAERNGDDIGEERELFNHGEYLDSLEKGLVYITQSENVGNRIQSYKPGIAALNLSGTAVSTIDEKRLKNPLKPEADDALIALRGKPTPRANGITHKRAIMQELYGREWHEHPDGKTFMEFLSQPATIFYGLFKGLIENKLASSVYHMSGGAFDGKLARPLAKHKLFVKLKDLFKADYREYAICGASFSRAEHSYAKWPMGNEAFISTNKPKEARDYIFSYIDDFIDVPLESRIVGQLKRAKGSRTGVELEGIEYIKGFNVYFSGRKKN